MSGILHNILLRFQVVGLWYSSTEAPIVPTDPRLVMEGLKVLGSRSPANLGTWSLMTCRNMHPTSRIIHPSIGLSPAQKLTPIEFSCPTPRFLNERHRIERTCSQAGLGLT